MESRTIEPKRLRDQLRSAAPGRFSRMEGLGVSLPAPDEISSPLPLSTLLSMLEHAELRPGGSVLVAGLHSAFLIEVLSRLVDSVFVVEASEESAERLRRHLHNEGISNARVRHGAQLDAWEPEAPFTSILADGANRRAIGALRRQLDYDGRLTVLTRSGRTGRIDYEQRIESDAFETHRVGTVRTHSTLIELLENLRILPDEALRKLSSLGDSDAIAAHLREQNLVEESDLVLALALHHGLMCWRPSPRRRRSWRRTTSITP